MKKKNYNVECNQYIMYAILLLGFMKINITEF